MFEISIAISGARRKIVIKIFGKIGGLIVYNSLMTRKKQVISSSRRCDIPAFQSNWFLQQLQQGYCLVPNPFNSAQISTISLKREDVEAFVFWTRNPAPFQKAIDLLIQQDFAFGFMITLTGYGPELEPCCPDENPALQCIRNLSALIGKNKIIWRYDPIIISDQLTFSWHLKNFSRLAEQIAPHVNGCIISLLDFYRKTVKNMKQLPHKFEPEPEKKPEFLSFLKDLNEIATENLLALSCCCETDHAFSLAGIKNSGCISNDWLAEITGHKTLFAPHKGQRKNCNCVFSKDIGAYDQCQHGCKYCYACR